MWDGIVKFFTRWWLHIVGAISAIFVVVKLYLRLEQNDVQRELEKLKRKKQKKLEEVHKEEIIQAKNSLRLKALQSKREGIKSDLKKELETSKKKQNVRDEELDSMYDSMIDGVDKGDLSSALELMGFNDE